MKEVTIYSDGSARSNPNGPGGYGTIIEYLAPSGQLHVREYSAGYKKTTNNRMELMGVITGLEALTVPCRVTIVTDSQYVVNPFIKNWIEGWKKKDFRRGCRDEVKNIDLWERLLKAKEGHDVSFKWIKGHNGHEQNEKCDRLACAAADSNPNELLDDKGFC